ncbi:hypothetical protein BLNAU_3103 [Blattamonas nauphoetae]|uniref:Uncharacterized protein n=1 Tax=Blattamonas nauphoetae TaxID=2049346 RepID=A0ABQ9YE83_9EUKA|nr:hypothetical protein BLNAU_3103 [Blattamonas nauphoetae]
MLKRPRTFLRLNISQQTLQTLAKPPTHSILPDPQHLRPPKMINRPIHCLDFPPPTSLPAHPLSDSLTRARSRGSVAFSVSPTNNGRPCTPQANHVPQTSEAPTRSNSTATLPQKKLPLPSIFRLGLYRVRIKSSISPSFSFLLPLLLDTGVANCGESSDDTTCGVGCDTHSRRAISAMSEWKKGGLGRWTVSSSLAPSSSSPSIRTRLLSHPTTRVVSRSSSSHSCVRYVCTENRSLCASSTRSVSSPPFPLFPNTVDRRGVDPNRTASDPVSKSSATTFPMSSGGS